ncbi:MAG: hypothetical protein A3G75_16170 [Verrucomicrobia bacterium RIFCSPLOWO2_12_FULL_64_8]|nr:MAG: hypothetical protein A3G75_16170 [Verrucomicrobia bacterium RIFCSPLOWO2_12_FULL_64_8]
MSAAPTSRVAPAPASSPETGAVDASARWPVVVFLLCSLGWLLTGTALALIASIKLHTPEFLGGQEWFTYGRVHSAQLNAFVYGWGMNAAFAAGLWLISRLAGAPLRRPGLLIVAGCFWNIGVKLGLYGILAGASTSLEWLEMPPQVTPLLLVAYALIGVWGVLAFNDRRSTQIYASEWYLLAAFFWFPWLYSVAQVMLVFAPVRGTVQAVIHAWYVTGAGGLFFAPVALAAAYYLLPKILGRPIRFYYLAPMAFWWLGLTVSFTAGARLTGGPVPAWIPSVGVVARFMMLVPLTIIAFNLLGTLAGRMETLRESLVLRFVVYGVISLLLAGLVGMVTSLRGVAAVTQFTLAAGLADHLLFHGAFSMIVFGALYFLLPRVLERAWPSTMLILTHYWAVALAVALGAFALAVGGWVQGAGINDAGVAFLEVVARVKPWLFVRSVAVLLLAIGHLAFLMNVVWLLGAHFVVALGTPAVFRPPPAMEAASAR